MKRSWSRSAGIPAFMSERISRAIARPGPGLDFAELMAFRDLVNTSRGEFLHLGQHFWPPDLLAVLELFERATNEQRHWVVTSSWMTEPLPPDWILA